LTYLDLSSNELIEAERRINNKPQTNGILRGASLPGNSMISSVFYAFPAGIFLLTLISLHSLIEIFFSVVTVGSVFSPLSLLIGCLILFLWKPILLELGSAMHLNGANYAYPLQVSGSTMGLVGAAITLLDTLATSTVSAATAASYLEGEFASSITLPVSVITIILLVGLATICLTNIRMSSSITLTIFMIHVRNSRQYFLLTGTL